jgi:hypothetical protein
MNAAPVLVARRGMGRRSAAAEVMDVGVDEREAAGDRLGDRLKPDSQICAGRE